MCTSDLSFWTVVSWSVSGPSSMTCVHQIFTSELWFLDLCLVFYVWHVYIRSFVLNYGFLISTWFFMNDMCTSDLSFWTMVFWSLPGPSCMTCVHQIFPSVLWFLGLYGFLVSTWSFMYDICTSDLSFWTMVSWSLAGPSCMTCVHQIFPSELWFLDLYLVLYVWHVYIRSFLLNYGFLVSTWSFMYDMCTSDLSFWTMVSWSTWSWCTSCMVLHVHVYIRSIPSELLFIGLSGSSCITYVHHIFPSELWFLGLYLVLHVWHVYIRSFLLNYGFLVLPGPSCMTCVHQIFPSKLWFLGLYLVLHVWHVYIRSFLLNYGFLVSTWSFMYDMCTSDLFLLNYGFLVSTWSFMYDMCTSDLSFWTMVSWSLPGPSCMTCVHQIFPSELWFLGLSGSSCMTCVHQIFPLWTMVSWSLPASWYIMCTSDLNYVFLVYLVLHVDMCTSDFSFWNYVFLVSTWCMCTSDLSFWTMVSWSLPGPSCMICVHQIFPSELWFLGLYLVLHVWHVYIRSFLLNYGFLVSTWSFMYDMCTSDLSFWTMVSWSTWSFMYDMCTSDLSFWTMVSWSLPGPSCMTCVHQIFPSELWFPGLYLVPSCMTCVHQIFPSELWFLGLYLVLHVWHVYIRSFLLNYGFLVYLVLHVYDMCTSDLSFWTMVSWSTWSFMYDMCTSDLSFWTMVSWSLPGPSCMTCVHQIFPSELWFLGLYLVLHVWHVYIRSFLLNYGFLVSTWFFMIWHVYIRSFLLNYGFLVYLVLHVWHVYIRSFLLNYGFLVSTWSFMYDMCTSDLSFWTMVFWSLPGPSCMTCVHQIFPSELWFLGLYLVLHVWHVYIRSFLLNYGFLVSTWSFMYDMCTSDLSFWTMVSWSLPGPSCMTCVHQIFPSELWFLCLPGPSCMTCVHQIFPSELWWFLVWHLSELWSFMYDMCTSDLSFWTMVSWSLPGPSCMTCVHQIFPSELWFLGLHGSIMYDMCTSDLSFWTMVSWSLPGPSCMTCVHQIFPSKLWFLGLPGPSCMTCVHQIFPSELWFLGLYLVLHVWHVYIRSSNYGFLVYLVLHVWHVYIRSFLLNYGFLVSTWSFMYDMCTSDLSFWTMVSLVYLVLHVWHVYIRSFLLNYGFLVSTWFFMYDMCTSDLSFWTLVSWSTWSFMNDMCTSDLSFWTMGSWSAFPSLYDMSTSDLSFWTVVSWSLPGMYDVYIRSFLLNYGFLVSPGPSCMTCVHQIFPSELWFLGLPGLHVWHVYIRSFLLNYGFFGPFMYMCTSDFSF